MKITFLLAGTAGLLLSGALLQADASAQTPTQGVMPVTTPAATQQGPAAGAAAAAQDAAKKNATKKVDEAAPKKN